MGEGLLLSVPTLRGPSDDGLRVPDRRSGRRLRSGPHPLESDRGRGSRRTWTIRELLRRQVRGRRSRRIPGRDKEDFRILPVDS